VCALARVSFTYLHTTIYTPQMKFLATPLTVFSDAYKFWDFCIYWYTFINHFFVSVCWYCYLSIHDAIVHFVFCQFLARTSRAYAMMSVSVCLWRKCIGAL